MLRVPPVDRVKQIAELRGADRHRPVGRGRPDEPAALQPLGVERDAEPVMPQDLDQVTSTPPEDEEIAGERLCSALHSRFYVSGEDMWRHRREASNSAASVSFAAT
jgi:hypothetical protein